MLHDRSASVWMIRLHTHTLRRQDAEEMLIILWKMRQILIYYAKCFKMSRINTQKQKDKWWQRASCLHTYCHAACTNTHTHTHRHTHTDLQLLVRWRLHVAYLSPAAVCGYCLYKREKRRLLLFYTQLQLMIQFSDVTRSQWAPRR